MSLFRHAGRAFRFSALCCALGFSLLIGGCATTDESDLPWNVPQTWEGSPTLPGMQQ